MGRHELGRPGFLHAFFPVMATKPMLGGYLAQAEEETKAPPIVVVSYAFWRNRLGGDRGIVGKNIMLELRPHMVIGVMPQGFDYPLGTQICVRSESTKAVRDRGWSTVVSGWSQSWRVAKAASLAKRWKAK